MIISYDWITLTDFPGILPDRNEMVLIMWAVPSSHMRGISRGTYNPSLRMWFNDMGHLINTGSREVTAWHRIPREDD